VPGAKFTSQVLDFGEEEFDVSLLHDWNEDSLFLVKSGTNKVLVLTSTVFANVAGYSLARTYS